MSPALPAGFGVVLDRHTRVLDGGRVLLGGSPRRALRLSPAGAAAFARLRRDGYVTDQRTAWLARRLVDAGVAHPRPPVAAGAAAGVTVIVPVRDRPAALDRCLAALTGADVSLGTDVAAGAHARAGASVLVVDDGSADPAAIAEIAARHGARLIRRPESGGPAAARNTGLAAASQRGGVAELVAFVDSDCVPSPGWLDRLAGHFADPAVVAVAPRIVPVVAPEAGRVLGAFAAARSPLDLGPDEALVQPGGRVSYVPTAALLVRRPALDGFDEALRYGEDVDAVWRLVGSGGRVRYDPSVTVAHAEPATWPAWLRRRHHYGTSAGPLARRHPDRLAPLVVAPWPAAVTALLLARRPLLATATGAVAAARLAVRLRRDGLPPSAAAPMIAEATAATLTSTGRAVTQLALPAAVALTRGRRRRLVTLAALVAAPALRDWLRLRPSLDPLRWTLASTADDLAYGTGVWRGAVRARTLRPLLPRRSRPR
ncbi:mycofactocin biosynthesis glycosyltransferase MftF [Jiangella alkaliphila]|uniref:Mycofactocin system glycosyltransferase n=1 Tax=Jiangella alkaliphila TaxID=419479 RepID=A0A1H2IJD9_9ACTN|nr:mycofactocin biosynthesis glycosyltransferase MftF [Jiangella alkaliphila]SDU44300.1 mycofactocin system glycosyltransferase [Jiangella alkaliphila]